MWIFSIARERASGIERKSVETQRSVGVECIASNDQQRPHDSMRGACSRRSWRIGHWSWLAYLIDIFMPSVVVGPSFWGTLPLSQVCSAGKRQSPIDIPLFVPLSRSNGPLTLAYRPSLVNVGNNGHSFVISSRT